jgi:ribosomal protein S18 acetylase RimI-like enzyme
VSFRFRVEPLGKQHNRKSFSCGVAPLDDYLRSQVSQDLKRLVANCFVAVETATNTLAGYYTLSASSVPLRDLPEATAKKLPRYQNVPVVRMGRLAVARAYQNEKLGAALLADAARRVLRSDVGAFALVVDAKDEQGVGFYLRHGFMRIEQTLTLFLPLQTLRAGSGET